MNMTTRYIYCHPLFDERKCAHRFSFQMAQTFASKGLELERFDYRGTGEAPGEFEDVTMETLRRDLSEFVGDGHASLIGVRLGASLAFDYSMRYGGCVRNLVLIEPVIDGAEYLDYMCRKQHIKDLMTGPSDCALTDDGFVNIEGFKTNCRLIEQMRQFSLVSIAVNHSTTPDILIAQISQSPGIRSDISSFVSSLNGYPGRILVESFHLPPFWERIPQADYGTLTNRILEWCNG